MDDQHDKRPRRPTASAVRTRLDDALDDMRAWLERGRAPTMPEVLAIVREAQTRRRLH